MANPSFFLWLGEGVNIMTTWIKPVLRDINRQSPQRQANYDNTTILIG
jgi:hypothetical protein